MWRKFLFYGAFLGLPASSLAETPSETPLQSLVVPFSSNEKLVLHVRPFEPKKHTIHKGDNGWLIDGGLVFGTDYSMPTSKLEQAYFVVGDKKIPLDTNWMYNAQVDQHENKATNVTLEKHAGGDAYRINAYFSDGAGSYQVQWKIVGSASARTLLIQSEEGWAVFCK